MEKHKLDHEVEKALMRLLLQMNDRLIHRLQSVLTDRTATEEGFLRTKHQAEACTCNAKQPEAHTAGRNSQKDHTESLSIRSCSGCHGGKSKTWEIGEQLKTLPVSKEEFVVIVLNVVIQYCNSMSLFGSTSQITYFK